MIKIFAAFAVLTVMISTVSVYNLKQATDGLEKKKRDISAQILKDRGAIKVLKAEMSYLSRPERLERLSRRRWVLDNTETTQLARDLSELTVRGNVQMVNMPVDNFRILLPRQKPEPRAITRRVEAIRVASIIPKAVELQKEKPAKREKSVWVSLSDRILTKIGN